MGLNIPAIALLDRCMPDRSEARFNFYPESSVEALSSGKNERIWPHTDFGVLTLLFQDGVGGLELEDRLNGRKFVPVTTCSPGASTELIVNTGDCPQRWTNNVIRAGLHRVIVPPDLKRFTSGVVPQRISCPFFLEADYEKSVGPLAQFVSEDYPALFDEITSIQYHRLRVEKEYSAPAKVNGVH
jgi:isopenicillin N synthase-like dioxygenase